MSTPMIRDRADMRQRSRQLVGLFSGLRILVIGDCFLDDWMYGRPDRLCREAPVPVMDVTRHRYSGGGAANTATNVVALGANCRLASITGADAVADTLTTTLIDAGVECGFIPLEPRGTVAKRRFVADGQIMLRIDEGDADAVPDRACDVLLEELDHGARGVDAVLVCDYGAGTCTARFIAGVAARRERLPLLVVDAHDPGRWARTRPDLMTPSFEEIGHLLPTEQTDSDGVSSAQLRPDPTSSDRAGTLAAYEHELCERTGARRLAVTLDSEGAWVCESGRTPHRTYASAVPAHATIGAGDCYTAAFTLSLAAGGSTVEAAELAQLAATLAVGDGGTAVCPAGELLAAVEEGRAGPDSTESGDTASNATGLQAIGSGHRVCDAAEAAECIERMRHDGARIVFTNGCFDVLHRGHVTYLDAAKRLGDVLVVAVTSDASVRRLKGDGRPANDDADRCAVVAALECVDYVVMFAEDTPKTLLSMLRPDVYVKGGDYPPEMIPERELVERLGGQVHVLDYIPDRSTSAIIARIRSSGAPAGTSESFGSVGTRS